MLTLPGDASWSNKVINHPDLYHDCITNLRYQWSGIGSTSCFFSCAWEDLLTLAARSFSSSLQASENSADKQQTKTEQNKTEFSGSVGIICRHSSGGGDIEPTHLICFCRRRLCTDRERAGKRRMDERLSCARGLWGADVGITTRWRSSRLWPSRPAYRWVLQGAAQPSSDSYTTDTHTHTHRLHTIPMFVFQKLNIFLV